MLLGRIASGVEDDLNHNTYEYGPKVKLHLCTKGGAPLHIMNDLVSYENDDDYGGGNIVDYAPINDAVYAEENSYIFVKATLGATLSKHGAKPDPFGKIPAQSTSVIRLSPSVRIDRYRVTVESGDYFDYFSYSRVIGQSQIGGKGATEQVPLFIQEDDGTDVEDNDEEQGDASRSSLRAGVGISNCHCMVIGSLSPLFIRNISLLHNGKEIIRSELVKENEGNHTFNAVIDLKKNGRTQFAQHLSSTHNYAGEGHLAFIVLDE